ncbi:MAG: S1C family serine protease [Acholeplasmataceae bacterium]
MKTKKIILSIMTILLTLTLIGCTIQTRATVTYESPSTHEQLRIDMIAEVEPSVVAVITESGHGSGIIYKSELVVSEDPSEVIEEGLTRYYVMTNNHVVEDGGEMKIHFGNGQDDIPVVDYQTYPLYDIAVVRIETTKALRVHPVAAIDDNTITEIVKGQEVIAIGSPQDISKFNYVTVGVVSMVTYNYEGVNGLAIMHDAELNPGNSGGPLFNLNGDLIGINVAKITNVQTSDGLIPADGLNYALNINKIAPIVRGFKEANYQEIVRMPRLGVTIQEVAIFLEENSASLLPPNPVGVVVVDFDLTRNAHLVLEKYDLIIKINNQSVTTISDLAAELEGAEFGDIHKLTVLRNVDGEFVEVVVDIELS